MKNNLYLKINTKSTNFGTQGYYLPDFKSSFDTDFIQTIDKIFIMGVATDIFIPVYVKIKEKFGVIASMEVFSVLLNYFLRTTIFLILKHVTFIEH